MEVWEREGEERDRERKRTPYLVIFQMSRQSIPEVIYKQQTVQL